LSSITGHPGFSLSVRKLSRHQFSGYRPKKRCDGLLKLRKNLHLQLYVVN
jgi:hypothetical protein